MDIWNSYLSANCFLFFYFINVGDSPLKFFVCFIITSLGNGLSSRCSTSS